MTTGQAQDRRDIAPSILVTEMGFDFYTKYHKRLHTMFGDSLFVAKNDCDKNSQILSLLLSSRLMFCDKDQGKKK